MNLLNIAEVETNVNLPKHTETTFILRNNFYVVTNGEVFNYYPIKAEISNEDSPLIRLEKTPPVVLEGYAIVGRKIYIVPLQDLQRKIIRKSREITREFTNANDSTDDSNNQSVSALLGALQPTPVQPVDESGLSYLTELEISKDADATWQDQIRALYDDPFAEEDDWEIQDPA